tara:strand:- start:1339 stop:2073 length:735 start_codon:yes stop_codon:yes gene_type:complete
MIEIGLVVLLVAATYNKWIPWQVSVGLGLVGYWLPKSLVVTPLNFFYPEIITNIKPGDNIALTFDDSPYGSEEAILNLLNEWDQKATFFIISDNVTPANRETLVKMVKSGHQLGNHGKTNSMHALKSRDVLTHEIVECDNLIKSIYNEANVNLPKKMVYRPGCGVFTRSMIQVASKLGYTIALGSVYPNDPSVRSGFINYYYLKYHLEKNDVIILHDRYWTIPMLQRLLPLLKERSVKSVTLTD